MDLPDVNIFVHAFRSDSADHQLCRTWLAQRLAGPEAVAISTQVLAGFIRVVTHARVFRRPSRLDEALRFCERLITSAACREVQPGARHWSIFSELCRSTRATGNEVPDAWFAALAIEAGCRWITLDRGFARFANLQLASPEV